MDAADALNQDRRIHCLFYFFAAHSVKDIDLSFLSELSGTVPIIPVVAKADTMTTDERNQYLSDLHRTIKNLSLSLNTSVTYDLNSARTGSDSQATDLPPISLDSNPNEFKSAKRTKSPRHSLTEISDNVEYSSGETSLESHLHTSHLYANADFDLDPTYATTEYTYKNSSCVPSPEFVALISQSTDFGESTGSVSSDDGNLLQETPLRCLSLCSIDSNENITDLNSTIHNEGAPAHDALTTNVDSPISWRGCTQGTFENSRLSKIDRVLSYRLSQDDSPDDDCNAETIFDKETFVNIGRALSDNAICENQSYGSSEANSHSAKDLSISSFEECEEDDDFVGSWSAMMDSAVLVGLPVKDGPSGSKGSKKLVSTTVMQAHHRASDDSESSLAVPLPVEKMICKLVTSKVCNSITRGGDKKACKMVSKYVCDRLVAGTGSDCEISDQLHDGIGSQERDNILAESSEERADAKKEYIITEIDSMSLGLIPWIAGKKNTACETPRDSEVLAPHADDALLLNHLTLQEDDSLPAFTTNASGFHIYNNIFAIANKKSAPAAISTGGISSAGDVDDAHAVILQKQCALGPTPVDLPISPSPFTASASPVRHSVQWAKTTQDCDQTAPCGADNSDMARLQLMIFQGMTTCIDKQACRCCLLNCLQSSKCYSSI